MSIIRQLSVLIVITAATLAGADFALKDGDTVVFYGDSITDQRLYTVFAEEYVLTRFPRLHIKFVHSGWGGDRVSGGGGGPIDLRLQRDVLPYKPTVVTIMLGMNDARYRAYDPDTFQQYATGYEHIIKAIKAALPGVRITAILPSPYDDVTRAPSFEGGYNAVLVRYSQYLRELAKREDLATADLNTEVVEALKAANASDPVNAPKLIPDRIHPGAAGHLLMAESLLKAWNAPGVVTSVELDVAKNEPIQAKATTVSQITYDSGRLTWKQLDDSLPMPVEWKDPLVSLAINSSDFVQALDQETLRCNGLEDGSYQMTIDGEPVGIFSAAQLATGINLAQIDTPMSRQAKEVAQLTVVHNNIHFARWRTIQVPLAKLTLTKEDAVLADMDALEDEVIALQRAAAQPKPHNYSLLKQ